MCDKIVDCLDGEDEINCNAMRTTSSLGDLFISTSKESSFDRKANLETKEAESSSSEEVSAIEESHKGQVETINNAQSSDSKKISDKESMVATVSHTNTTTSSIQTRNDDNFKLTTNLMNDQLQQQQRSQTDMSEDSTNTDFMKVSSNIDETVLNKNPVELNSKSSESLESFTVDPDGEVTNNKAETNVRGDMQSFATIVSKESLESRSSVLENKDADIHEVFSDTLNIDSPTSFSTTTTETTTLDESTSNQNTGDSNHKSDGSDSKQNHTTETNSSKNNSTHLSTIFENGNTDMESKDILIDLPDQITGSPHKEHPHKFINEDNSTESEAKHFISTGNKGILDKLKDIIAHQLQPAKQEIKHLIPNTFECQR